ncbi:MAG TPA: hypothetical protein VK357_14700 [Rubrobacteraceae bacterium]|nr:hypothetical protein [Rubrobacteraceae bacterium]
MSFFSSTAGKSGNGELNGAFAKDSAQNRDPNFGQEISGPPAATNYTQK